MARVLIGRVGGALHPFEQDDVQRGAVRDSKLFPELYQSAWPTLTAGALVTRVERKHMEHTAALCAAGYDFPLHLPQALFPRAVEDSKEAQQTPAHIAAVKVYKSFLNPVRVYAASLSSGGRQQFYQAVATRAGIYDIRNLVAIGDDRDDIVDRAYLDPVYGDLREHWNPQVKEVFKPGHDVPGKRVKETDSAHYGVANSVYRLEKITASMRAQGITVDEAHRLNTTLCIIPVVPGTLPLPEEGIVIFAEGDPIYNKPFSEEYRKNIHKGRILTYDHFNVVSYPGVPEGTTAAELKAMDPKHPYLVDVHSPARAMLAFAGAVGIDKKSVWSKKRPSYSNGNHPKTVISSAMLLTAPPDLGEVSRTLLLPEGADRMKLSGCRGGFDSLYHLERLAHSGQAFVVQHPDRFSIAKTDEVCGVSEADIRLLRRLETDLIFSYLITMSTQPGAPNHIGRSHLVEKGYYKQFGLWHPDFSNMSLAGDVEKEAYRLYENVEELQDGLRRWDRTTYQHDVNSPRNDSVDEDYILQCLGRDNLGFVTSGYGSASSFLDAAYKDAFAMFYELSRRGVTTVDGGGVRSSMLGMREGALKAREDGYNVLNLGIRSETDVSPLEGNIEDWISGRGFLPQKGRDSQHLHFADGQMHIIKLQRLLQRQAPIAALAHAHVFFPGGKGTMVEKCIARLHNARVRILGEGIFPEFSSNKRFIPIIDIDHEFEYLGQNRKLWDVVNEPYKDKLTWLGHYSFSGQDRVRAAMEFIQNYAEGRIHLDGQTEKLSFDLNGKERRSTGLDLSHAAP
jgi:predicted Rossmann-fold nucleotide-binding protein